MQLERYEILTELGRGGFGVVYKARQLATGQPVAIKMLRDAGGKPEDAHQYRARFEREMKLCAQLHHPNIVRLIDSGILDDGRLFAAFEYVSGQTLSALLAERGALEPVQAQHLMLQVLDAVGCAHTLGVVHRDLKPQNIMVAATGARLNALVLDFGLGSLGPGTGLQERDRLTGPYDVLGTPGYSAPEQLRGLPTTPASDLFAWALVFLECLTGTQTITGRTLQEILYQQLGPDPIPLPAALQDHPLGRILSRLLSKDLKVREGLSAAQLLREVEACSLRDLSRGLGSRQPPEPEDGEANAPTVSLREKVLPLRAPDPHSLQREGAQRQVTALCCTLSVSSVPGHAIDVEESDELIALGQQLCTAIARSFGGAVGAVLGDQILLYFGLENPHPEDARRAARAALQILQGVRAHNLQPERQQRAQLDVRASIHAGLAVVPRGPRQVGGTVPRIAAQLCAQARPWEALVSADAAPLLQPPFLLEPAAAPQHAVPQLQGVFRLQGEQAAHG
jgi:serine/threonine protein kinase